MILTPETIAKLTKDREFLRRLGEAVLWLAKNVLTEESSEHYLGAVTNVRKLKIFRLMYEWLSEGYYTEQRIVTLATFLLSKRLGQQFNPENMKYLSYQRQVVQAVVANIEELADVKQNDEMRPVDPNTLLPMNAGRSVPNKLKYLEIFFLLDAQGETVAGYMGDVNNQPKLIFTDA